jgi:hypothetical protein
MGSGNAESIPLVTLCHLYPEEDNSKALKELKRQGLKCRPIGEKSPFEGLHFSR